MPDFEVLDSKIASGPKKFLTADFKTRVYMEEQKAQQDNRFLNGRHIAHMIYDYLMISGTGEALLDFKDLLRVQLVNDNLQSLGTKWDELLLSVTKVPDEDIQGRSEYGTFLMQSDSRNHKADARPALLHTYRDAVLILQI